MTEEHEKIRGFIRDNDRKISELEASSASHTENKDGLRKLEKAYDQLSNWSVGIDLHIGELEKRVEGIYKSVHGIESWDKLKILEEQIDKLAKYILEYFPGSIVNEGACLTAIGIMEEQRNK